MSNNVPAIAKELTRSVESTVRQMEEQKQIELPQDYSVSNALRSAFLAIQETKDKNNKPALEVCTQTSITNALLNMVVQGLTPAREQCYYVCYGQQLVCQRSYFGDIALAQRVDPRIQDVIAEPIFHKDEFSWAIERGKKVVEYHKPGGLNDRGDLAGAYCIVLDTHSEPIKTEIMNRDEIIGSWKKSRSYPIDDKGNIKTNSTHYAHPGEMAKRTVIRRCLKPIINSSNDGYLLRAIDSTEETQAEVQAEEQENANQEVLDVTPQQGPTPEQEEKEHQVYPPPQAESDGTAQDASATAGTEDTYEGPADDHPDAPQQGSEAPPEPPEPKEEPQPEEAEMGETSGDTKEGEDDEPPF